MATKFSCWKKRLWDRRCCRVAWIHRFFRLFVLFSLLFYIVDANVEYMENKVIDKCYTRQTSGAHFSLLFYSSLEILNQKFHFFSSLRIKLKRRPTQIDSKKEYLKMPWSIAVMNFCALVVWKFVLICEMYKAMTAEIRNFVDACFSYRMVYFVISWLKTEKEMA